MKSRRLKKEKNYLPGSRFRFRFRFYTRTFWKVTAVLLSYTVTWLVGYGSINLVEYRILSRRSSRRLEIVKTIGYAGKETKSVYVSLD